MFEASALFHFNFTNALSRLASLLVSYSCDASDSGVAAVILSVTIKYLGLLAIYSIASSLAFKFTPRPPLFKVDTI